MQEDLKDGIPLKAACNNQEKQKPDIMSRSEKEPTKLEKIQEDMNMMKVKNEISSEKMEPIKSRKFPPELVERKTLSMPNRKRIMIRSRL